MTQNGPNRVPRPSKWPKLRPKTVKEPKMTKKRRKVAVCVAVRVERPTFLLSYSG